LCFLSEVDLSTNVRFANCGHSHGDKARGLVHGLCAGQRAQEKLCERLHQDNVELRDEFLEMGVVMWTSSAALSVHLSKVRKRPGSE
jgi:hypothetical protein